MKQLAIRSLAVADIETLRRIDRVAHDLVWSSRTFLDQIDDPDRMHLVGVSVDGSVVGHAAAFRDGRIGRVTNIAVDRHHRGHGHGSQLFAALLASMLPWAHLDALELEVGSDNLPAQRMYRRFGFAPVGLRRDFYASVTSGASHDAIVMIVDSPHSPEWVSRLRAIESATTDDRGGHRGEAA